MLLEVAPASDDIAQDLREQVRSRYAQAAQDTLPGEPTGASRTSTPRGPRDSRAVSWLGGPGLAVAGTGQQRGQLAQRLGDGDSVLVLTPPGNRAVPDLQDRDERSGGAAAGGGHGPGKLVLDDDHVGIGSLMDGDFPALLEPRRQ